MSKYPLRAGGAAAGVLAGVAAALLAACSTPPPPPPAEIMVLPPPAAPPQVAQPPAEEPPARVSEAGTPRAYRKDAAGHLYGLHADRIYKGRMPPLLYAIGVVQVQVGQKGQVEGISWMRAPRHAPEVIAEIESMVRAAAPFPAPARMGKVVYTDTFLWHKSGRFQLDTLTEGQD
jgi:hypothetical protein